MFLRGKLSVCPRIPGSEVQAYYKFDGAHINQRLHRVWDALGPAPEVKELHDARYKQLMQDKGINRDEDV